MQQFESVFVDMLREQNLYPLNTLTDWSSSRAPERGLRRTGTWNKTSSQLIQTHHATERADQRHLYTKRSGQMVVWLSGTPSEWHTVDFLPGILDLNDVCTFGYDEGRRAGEMGTTLASAAHEW